MKRSLRNLPAWTGFLILILLFLAPALAPGKVLLPLDIVVQAWPPWQRPNQVVTVHNPLITDVVDYIYPVKAFAAEQVKESVLPLWNPYVLGGYPLTYNTQAALFYPLSLFYYLLSPVTAVGWVIIVQLFLGAAFMFAYLRQLHLRPIAAWLGAVVFIFNGMMVVWLEWQVVQAAVIWLPLQLLLIERIAQKLAKNGHFRDLAPDAVYGGLAFGLPWLGGHWHWALYGSMTAVLYLLWRLVPIVRCRSKNHDWTVGWIVAKTAVLLLGTGIGVSLIQVLPAFNYLRQGHRQPFTFSDSLNLGLKEWAVVALIPDFFGNPIHKNWWGETNYNEITYYVGLLPLFLALLALVLRRDQLTAFFAAWGGLGLLWALGTPVYGLLYVLPVFNGLWPSRAMTILLLCTAVLAALGFDALLTEEVLWLRVRRTMVFIAISLLTVVAGFILWYQPDLLALQDDLLWFGLSLIVIVGLLWLGPIRLRPTVFAVLVAGWVVADLFWLGADYNTVGDAADLYPPTATAAFLHNDPELFRIATLPEGVAYPPNSSLPDRLQTVTGYEPAILQTMVDYISSAEGSDAIYFERELMPLHGLDSPLIDALNVKYVVTINDQFQQTAVLGQSQQTIEEWARLEQGMTITQPFSVPDAGLHRLDIALQPLDAAGTVTLRLFSADGRQELAHADWDVSEPLDSNWATFYFGAFPSEWGRDFLFTVIFAGEGEMMIGTTPDGLTFRTYYFPRPGLVHEAGKTSIYLNEGYFPRAYVVGQAILAHDAADALAQVQEHAGELDRLVVLEAAQPPPPQLETAVSPASRVTVTNYGLNQVVLDVNLDDAGFVVLADTYYPGWRARLDGTAVPVYRANGLVRALYVPAGEHTVTFSFWPLDFMVGSAVTLLTLLFALAVLMWARQEARS
jgi:hypothetical protein